MKLMYDLPEVDKAAFEAVASGEKTMYVIPFNIVDDKFVNGWTCVTDKRIYCILDGKVLSTFELARCTVFSTEVLYGNCAFYAVIDGTTTLICRFLSGRNLPRYSVLVQTCEVLAEKCRKAADPGEPVVNNEAERFCPTCGRPFIAGSKICPFCRNTKEVYMKLWGLTKGLRLMLFFPLLVSAISLFFSFLLPQIQKVAVNDYLLNEGIRPVTSMSDPNLRAFMLIFLAIISIDLASRILGVLQSRVSAISGNKFTLMMRTLLYEKISTLSVSSIGRKSTGDLMGRITGDVNAVQSFVTGQLPSLFSQAVSFVFALALLLILDPMMSLFVFIPLPLIVYLVSKFWNTMQRRNVKNWVLAHHVNLFLQDVLNGIRVVKAFGNEEREIKNFHERTNRSSKYSEGNAKLYDTVFPLLAFGVRIGSYLIMFYGNYLLFKGTMSYGELHQFNSYANIIYGPLLTITFIPRQISEFLTSLGKVLEILEEEPEVSDIGLPIDISIEGDVSIRNVTFGYDSYNPVLENINFEVKKGEMIGIVGHSGCGKTTLINLLMRLYDVTEGEILIDGVNIKDISQNALRSQIGVVLQETFLFSGTIYDNIAYAKPDATRDEVITAAKIAGAHSFIMKLPNAYNTRVGERGHTLSGGERQRVAIARALLHNPRILILDEATASLDTETEKQIQDALQKLIADRTTLAIAHRLSTLRNATRILVLDKGGLAEMGSHEELMRKKGIYYGLVMAQRQMSKMSPKNEAPAELAKTNAS